MIRFMLHVHHPGCCGGNVALVSPYSGSDVQPVWSQKAGPGILSLIGSGPDKLWTELCNHG